MSWIRKNPFDPSEDPSQHMLALLANEAEQAGDPFSELEKEILSSGILSLPWDLDAKARNLIAQLLEKESAIPSAKRDPKGLGNCLEWCDYGRSTNLTELTYQVASARNVMHPAPIDWRVWFKEKIGLIGCGLAAVILLMLFAAAIEFLFDHK